MKPDLKWQGVLDLLKKVLLIYDLPSTAAGATSDHVEAFSKYSQHDIYLLPAGQETLGELPETLELSRFDIVIIHYSIVISHDNHLSPRSRRLLREFDGLKSVFVQDDYRWINETVNALDYMKVDVLFPLTEPSIMDQVYDPKRLPNIKKQTVLTGYVPESLLTLEVLPYAERSIDVGYRARKLPAWIGSHSLQKWQIAERFIADSKIYNLRNDISTKEEDRIYQENWVEFISNCKATLGTESGASLCDFTGQIQKDVEEHEDKYPGTDFETLKSLYFKDQDCAIMMNVISPRVFEAAALKTLMIFYDGEYSGILKPDVHYVLLEKDHSNFEKVIDTLRNPDRAEEIIDNAYQEVAQNERYSYKGMVKLVEKTLEEKWSSGNYLPSSYPITRDDFEICLAVEESIFEKEVEKAESEELINEVEVEKAESEELINEVEVEKLRLRDMLVFLASSTVLVVYIILKSVWGIFPVGVRNSVAARLRSKNFSSYLKRPRETALEKTRKIWRLIPAGPRLLMANSILNPMIDPDRAEKNIVWIIIIILAVKIFV